MEFESMDDCFPTAQGDSEITCNVPPTHGPMAPTTLNWEPCGSSPLSISTASIAAITAPFQNGRFGTISGHYGRSLEKCLSSSVTLPAVAATTGAIAWSGYLATIPLSLIAPLLVYCAKSRTHAFSIMFCYYSAATWPVIPGARAFFGDQGTPLIGLFLCLTAATLLALPWGLLFMRGQGKAALYVPLCVVIAATPPLGVIGWASPLLSAGVLFPGSKWLGLGLIIVFLSLVRFMPGLSAVSLALCALVFQLLPGNRGDRGVPDRRYEQGIVAIRADPEVIAVDRLQPVTQRICALGNRLISVVVTRRRFSSPTRPCCSSRSTWSHIGMNPRKLFGETR